MKTKMLHTSGKKLLVFAALIVGLLFTTKVNATVYYSVATNNWNVAATWSLSSGGAGGAGVPTTGDDAIIEGGYTVTVTANALVTNLTINSNGTLVNTTFTVGISGNLAVNGTFNAGTGVYTFSGATKTISGSATIPSVTVSGTCTNNGTLKVTTALAGGGGLTNGATGVLDISFSGAVGITTLNASTSGNKVIYSYAGVQTVFPTTYSNLTLSGSGAKTTSTVTVNGILSMEETATASAAITFGGSATLQYNTLTSRTVTNEWPATFSGSGGVIIKNSGVITVNTNKTINAPLTTFSNSTLNMATFQLLGTLTTITNNGTIETQCTTTPIIPTGKTWGGAVLYDGPSQTVATGTYNRLRLAGTGANSKTITTASTTVNGELSMEGTATASAAPTYGAAATLHYDTPTARTAGPEWITPFAATGGVIIGNTGAITMNVAKTFSTGNPGVPLTIESGATLNSNGLALTLNGIFINNGTFVPGTSTVTFSNATPVSQYISGTSTTTFYNLTVNNAQGLIMQYNAIVNNTLTFTAGIITVVPTAKLTLGASATISGSSATAYVYGTLEWNVDAAHLTRTFIIGDVNTYTPVTIVFSSISAAGTVAARTSKGDHPNISTSIIVPSKSVNRYWTLTPGGALAFTNYGATFTFVAGDLDASAATANFVIQRYASSVWNSTTTGTRAATTTQATGITALGDFQIGEPNNGLYYKSVGTGNWATTGTWNTSTDSITWGAAAAAPTNFAKSITISTGNTVHIAAAATASNLTIIGTLDHTGATTLNINGRWVNKGTYTAGTGTIIFDGDVQTMNGTNPTTFNNLTMSCVPRLNYVSGVTLNGAVSATVNGALTLTYGVITTGTNTLTLGVSATSTGAKAKSYVNGNLQWTFGTTGNPQSKTFYIGDNTTYTPVALSALTVTAAGTITAFVTPGDHPNISTSGIDANNSVNRYWTLTPTTLTFSGTYTAQFTYNGKFTLVDVDPLTDTSTFSVRKYASSTWTTLTSAHTAKSTTASGISTFGQFAVGNACTAPVNPTSASATPSSTICNGGYALLKLTGGGGGSGGTGQTVAWYTGSCGGTLVGKIADSLTLLVRPTTTTTYYGRYESGPPCNVTSAACSSVTVTVSGTAPVITEQLDYCSKERGQTAVTITTPNITSVLWNTGSTANPFIAPQAGLYTVTVTATGGCTNIKTINVGEELIQDGNFSAGNSGFSSSYTYYTGTMYPEGIYTVTKNAHYFHSNFQGYDHTNPGTGLFLDVNGSIQVGNVVWEETVTVSENQIYFFNAWATSMNQAGNYALLQFSVNDVLLGTPFQLPPGVAETNPTGPFVWLRFFSEWNSGSNTTAHIKVVDLQTAPDGNDFGLDDISFSSSSPSGDMSINPANSLSCETGLIELLPNISGGTPPYTYSWTGPGGYTSSQQFPTLDPTSVSTLVGTYSLTVTDNCILSASGSTSVMFNRFTGGTDWNTAGNWTQGIPTSTIDAIIPPSMHPVINNTGMACKELIISPTASLTINPGKELKVYGCTGIHQQDGLYLKSDATGNAKFIDNGSITYTNNGSAQVELYLTTCLGFSDQFRCWHYVTAPVLDARVGVFNGDYMKYYIEPSGAWSPYIVHSGDHMNQLQGYAVSANGDGVRTFHGELIIGNQTTTPALTRTVNLGWGWNLVGNPYASPVDLNSSFITWNHVDAQAYYLDQAAGNYKVWPATNPYGYGLGTRYPLSMQGFFVHVTEGQTSGSITWTNTARTFTSDHIFYKNSVPDLLWMKVEKSTGLNDEIIVCFNPLSTNNIDKDIDCSKINGDPEAPQLYSVTPDESRLSINTMPFAGINTEVPLEFYVETPVGDGNYSITASNLESFRAGTTIALEDKKLQSTQDLTVNPVYNFNYAAGDDPARFVLHFRNPFYGVEDPGTVSDLQIYSYGDNVYLKDLTGNPENGVLYLYNMMGQEVAHKTVSAISLNKYTFNLPDGYYVVRVITKDKIYNCKVYLD
jgi:hypothetical protein